jgi:CelD/BcsL family acetyltransferase involved in cellulose biosynthesis
MKCSSDRLLVAEVVEDSRAFAALEQEWDDLYQNCLLATPFQSWAWLYSWWEAYGAYYKLQLIALRDGRGLLVGAMPLMLEHRQGLGKLLFIGTGLSDYLDMLVRRGWEEGVSEAGIRVLHSMDSWHVADLQQLRPDAAAWSIFRKWPGPRSIVWQSSCPVIDVKPWDELVASLSRKQRSAVRRTLRRAEADGLRPALAGADDAEQAGHRLVALHREAWRGRNIASTHLTREFESHMVAAAVRMTARELGAISEFWQDGEVIASNFLLFGHSFVGGYMGGARQKACRRYQVSTLKIWDAMNIARIRNSSRLDLLRGEEPYKLRWNPTIVPNHRVILGRSLVFWGPYAGYRCLRSRAQRHLLAHPESALRWAKALAAKYHAQRYRAAN